MNVSLQRLRALLDTARPRTTLGVAGPSEVRRVRTILERAMEEIAAWPEATGAAPAPDDGRPAPIALADYRASIDAFNARQTNAELLNAIRAYNHTVIEALHQSAPLGGRRVLDVGASPHGYALEHALMLGAASYDGIGLDVDEPVLVAGPTGVGELRNANAEALPFADGHFDLIVSMSTFEHVTHVDRALREMWRVLKSDGRALVTFEPIWTSSYGHHLHHFGPIAAHMPDWAQLLWTRDEMRRQLSGVWPADGSPDLEAATAWVYESDALNRIGIREMRQLFAESPFTVEWIQPMRDSERDAARCAEVAAATGLSPDELMTKGLSALLRRV